MNGKVRDNPLPKTSSSPPENRMTSGGCKDFLCSSRNPGEIIQFDSYFSDGLKPPTSRPSQKECHLPTIHFQVSC